MGMWLECCSREPTVPEEREVADEVRRLMALRLYKALQPTVTMLVLIQSEMHTLEGFEQGLMSSELSLKRIILGGVWRMAYKELGWKQGDH